MHGHHLPRKGELTNRFGAGPPWVRRSRGTIRGPRVVSRHPVGDQQQRRLPALVVKPRVLGGVEPFQRRYNPPIPPRTITRVTSHNTCTKRSSKSNSSAQRVSCTPQRFATSHSAWLLTGGCVVARVLNVPEPKEGTNPPTCSRAAFCAACVYDFA